AYDARSCSRSFTLPEEATVSCECKNGGKKFDIIIKKRNDFCKMIYRRKCLIDQLNGSLRTGGFAWLHHRIISEWISERHRQKRYCSLKRGKLQHRKKYFIHCIHPRR